MAKTSFNVGSSCGGNTGTATAGCWQPAFSYTNELKKKLGTTSFTWSTSSMSNPPPGVVSLAMRVSAPPAGAPNQHASCSALLVCGGGVGRALVYVCCSPVPAWSITPPHNVHAHSRQGCPPMLLHLPSRLAFRFSLPPQINVTGMYDDPLIETGCYWPRFENVAVRRGCGRRCSSGGKGLTARVA